MTEVTEPAASIDVAASNEQMEQIMALEQDLLDLETWEEEVFADGVDYNEIDDSECILSGVLGPGDWRNVRLTERGIAETTDGMLVLMYEISAERADGEPHRALVSMGYANGVRGWKMAFQQHSLLQAN
ncbi:hypothetical protein U91I_03854 [alpha proteobacterium U9-1i]|nr:hypothetical protein U91I_03854 [alpha proteobacterium U9-1i]